MNYTNDDLNLEIEVMNINAYRGKILEVIENILSIFEGSFEKLSCIEY